MSKLNHRSWAAVLLIGLSACRTGPPLPKIDLSEPGFTVRQGQAVWRPKPGMPEIAGELIAATRGDQSFVQFTKTPFALAIAQTAGHRWQAEFPPEHKRYSAPGNPPARIIWFELARALDGKPLAKHWLWTHKPDETWRLENKASGEYLEGYFNP